MITPESGYMVSTVNDVTSARVSSPSVMSGNSIPTPSKDPMTVGTELKYFDSELGTLHGFIDALRDRLEPVLAPSAPDSTGQGIQRPMGMSALVMKVRDEQNSLRAANDRLADLLRRIEL